MITRGKMPTASAKRAPRQTGARVVHPARPLQQAMGSLDKGRLEEAEMHLWRAVKSPDSIASGIAGYNLGQLLWQQGRAKEAIDILSTVTRRARRSVGPHAALMLAEFLEDLGRFAEARKALKKAARSGDETVAAEARLNLATLDLEAHQNELAKAELLKLTESEIPAVAAAALGNLAIAFPKDPRAQKFAQRGRRLLMAIDAHPSLFEYLETPVIPKVPHLELPAAPPPDDRGVSRRPDRRSPPQDVLQEAESLRSLADPFVPGSKYRRASMHLAFGGEPTARISTATRAKWLFLFGEPQPYNRLSGPKPSGRRNVEVYFFRGETTQTAEPSRRNAALANHQKRDLIPVLFERVTAGIYEFIDVVSLVGAPQLRGGVSETGGVLRPGFVFALRRAKPGI